MNPGTARLTRTLALSALALALAAPRAPAQDTTASAADWAARNEVVYQIFVRSFRDSNGDRIGDLRGIQEELPYLQRLGVTSLLLTPVNPSPTYHNYFASAFYGVDPDYGDARALHALVAAVHARGMKIYLDEEIQYATFDNPWFVKALGHPLSPYGHYLLYDGPGNTDPSPIIYGLKALPTWTGVNIPVAPVNLHDPAVLRYFEGLFASLASRRGDDVDGFRLDHMQDELDGNPRLAHLFDDFWAPVLAAARAVHPGLEVFAEQADWGFGEDWLTRGRADLVFAFPLERAIGSLNRDSIAAAIRQTLARTPPGKGQLIFIENHDMSRFASRMGGDLRKEKVGAALDVLLAGTPLIYYGQEIGMLGEQSHAWSSDANDIPDREAMKWTAKVACRGCAVWYQDTGPWWTNRFNRDDDGISVAEEQGDPNSLLSFYRTVLALRRERAEIRLGDERVLAAGAPGVLAVLRATPAAASLLLVNLSDSAATAAVPRDSLPATLSGPLVDLLSGGPPSASGAALGVALPPWGIALMARAGASGRGR